MGATYPELELLGATYPELVLVEGTYPELLLLGATYPELLLVGATYPELLLVGATYPELVLVGATYPELDVVDTVTSSKQAFTAILKVIGLLGLLLVTSTMISTASGCPGNRTVVVGSSSCKEMKGHCQLHGYRKSQRVLRLNSISSRRGVLLGMT